MFYQTSKSNNSEYNSSEEKVNKNRISIADGNRLPPAPTSNTPTQLFVDEEKQEESIQKKGTNEIKDKEAPSKGSSTKLPNDVKSKMEGSFGTDLSSVNIHTNDESATNMGALAYTQGKDVHFAPGQYNPSSTKGQELIGHELTHTIQQSQGRVKPDTAQKKNNINTDKSLETEADKAGAKAAKGEPTAIPGTTNKQIQKKEITESEEEGIQLKTEIHSKENAISTPPDESNSNGNGTPNSNITDNKSTQSNAPIETATNNGSSYSAVLNDKSHNVVFLKKPLGNTNTLKQSEYVENFTKASIVDLNHKYKDYHKVIVDGIDGERYVGKHLVSDLVPKDTINTQESGSTGVYALVKNNDAKIKEDVNSVSEQRLLFNDRVLINYTISPELSQVTLEDGYQGLVQNKDLEYTPCPGSELYHIESSDTLETILADRYKLKSLNGKFANSETYEKVIYEANNSGANEDKGISSKFSLIPGQWMWIPPIAYSVAKIGIEQGTKLIDGFKDLTSEKYEDLKKIIIENFPDGVGFEIDSNIGLTFGYPVGLNSDLATVVTRKGDKIILRKYNKMVAGADVGLGYGAYFGLKKGAGAGADANINAEKMFGAFLDISYEFPINEKGDFVTALLLTGSMSILQSVSPIGMLANIIGILGHVITGIDKYISSFEAAVGREDKVHGSVELGARLKGNENNADNNKGQLEHGKDIDTGNIRGLMGMLNARLAVDLGTDLFFGAKVDDIKRNPETQQIEEATATVFAKQGAHAILETPILLGGDYNGDVKAAEKILFKYTKSNGIDIWKPTYAASIGFGELGSYKSDASEMDISFDNEIECSDITDYEQLIAHMTNMKLTKRFMFGGVLGLVKNKEHTTKMNAVLNASSYLTFEFVLSKELAGELIDILGDFADKEKFKELPKALKTFVTTGVFPIIDNEDVQEKLTSVLTRLAETLKEVIWHTEIGTTLGAGFKAAEGLKVRAEGNIGASITFTKNILNDVKPLLEDYKKIEDLLAKGAGIIQEGLKDKDLLSSDSKVIQFIETYTDHINKE